MRTTSRARVRIVFLLFVSLTLVSISGTLSAGVEENAPPHHHATRSIAKTAVRLQISQSGFGSVSVGAATTQTVTFQFAAAATLSAVNILTGGASGLDYTDGGGGTCVVNTSYAPGDSCMVNVSFSPTVPGMRAGAVILFAQGSTLPLMTSYLNGIGQSGSVTIDPGTQKTIGTISSGAAYGAAVDGAGNVYVVDRVGGQVIELAASSGTFTPSTVLTGLSSPTAVAVDGAGNLYVSDTQNNQVVMVPNETGALNAGDKSIISISGLGAPHGIAVDGNGNLYVADATNGDVIEVPAGGGTPVTVAQGLTAPHGLAVDAGGNVYVATNNTVTEYPFGGGTPVPLGGGYNNPRGLAVDAAGNVYVADTGHGTIAEFPASGASQSSFAITGLTAPQSVSLDSAGNLYVTDGGNVYEVNRAQTVALTFPATNVGSTSAAQTLTVSNSGNLPLTIASVAIPANFVQGISSGTDCSSNTNLPSAGQCLIAVAFAPMQSGALSGSLTVVDNALNNPVMSTQSVQLSGSAMQVAQTISFTTGAPASATYNTNFTVVAAAGSGLPVVYTSSGSCTNSGATYTMTSGTGTCTVVTDQPGNSEYLPAPEVTQTVSASPASQTISFTTNAPPTAVYNSIFSVLATATSSLPVVYTSSGACTNIGGTYTMISGTGTCSVIASQGGNNNYSAAPPVTQTVSASLISQTLTFTANAPATAVYNSPFNVVATATSSLAVVYTSSGACTNIGGTYTMISGTGTCSVIANQAGNNNYSGAPQVIQTVTASVIAQTITFTINAPTNAAYNSSFTVAAITSSGSPVAFTSAGACGNSGATYTITSSTGTCSVFANQPGNTNYSAAPQVTQSTAATIAAQTITVTTKAPASAAYNSSFTVLAGASSSLPILFSSSGACTNSGATYTMTAATGTCTVIANQAGNANYTAAPKITELTTASKASPTVALGGVPPTAPYQSTFTVTTSTNASTTAVIKTSGSCSISGTIVTITSGSGGCTVTVNWATDPLYVATSISRSTTAQKLPPTIAWAPPAAITYGTALNGTQLNATASSGATALTGAFVYAPASGNIPLAGNDTLSVTFTPTNNANYANATGSVTLLVNQLSTTTKITGAAPSAPIVGRSVQANFSVTASYSKPTQRVTVNSSTGETCSATLSSGAGFCSLTFLTAGPRTLTAAYSGDNNNSTSISAGVSLSVATSGWVSLGALSSTPATTCTSSEASGSGCSGLNNQTGGRNWMKLNDDRFDKCMLYWGGNPNSLAGTLSESMNCWDVTHAITAGSITGAGVNNKLLWSWLNHTGYNLTQNEISTVSCSNGSPNQLTITMQSNSFADVYLAHFGPSIYNAGDSYIWISGTGTWSGGKPGSGTYHPSPFDSRTNGPYQVTSILAYNSSGAPAGLPAGEFYEATEFTTNFPASCPASFGPSTLSTACNQNQNACIGAPLDDAQDPEGRHFYGGMAWDINRSVLWAGFGTGAIGDPNQTLGSPFGSVSGDSSITDFYKFSPNASDPDNTTGLPQWHLQCTSQGTAPACPVGEVQEGAMSHDPTHDLLFMFGGDSTTTANGRIYCIRDGNTPSSAGPCPTIGGVTIASNTWTAIPSGAPWNAPGQWDFPMVIFDPDASVGTYTGEFVIFGGNVQDNANVCPAHSFPAGFDEGGISTLCQPANTYFYDPVNGFTVAYASAATTLGVDMPSDPRSPPCGYDNARQSIICVADGGSGPSGSYGPGSPLTTATVWEWKSSGTTASGLSPTCGQVVPANHGLWCQLGIPGSGPALNTNLNNNLVVGNMGGFDNDANAFFLLVNQASPMGLHAYALPLP